MSETSVAPYMGLSKNITGINSRPYCLISVLIVINSSILIATAQ